MQYRIQCYLWFQAFAEGLGVYPLWIRGTSINIFDVYWEEYFCKINIGILVFS
jgi:hypothetical protein